MANYICFRSTTTEEASGIGASFDGYMYYAEGTTSGTDIVLKRNREDATVLANDESNLIDYVWEFGGTYLSVYASSFDSSGYPTQASVTVEDMGAANVANLSRYPEGDIAVNKYIDKIQLTDGKTYHLRTKTSELVNDSGFVSNTESITGDKVQVAYTHKGESTETTLNQFCDAVDHDIDNLTTIVPTDCEQVVTTNTNQTITGNKTFSNTIVANGGVRMAAGQALSAGSDTLVQMVANYSANDTSADSVIVGAQGSADRLVLQASAGVLHKRGSQFFEVIDSGNITNYINGDTGGGGGSVPTLTWYTGNTGNTLTVSGLSTHPLVIVFRNGLLMQPTEDYTLSADTITFTTALEATDKVTLGVF